MHNCVYLWTDVWTILHYLATLYELLKSVLHPEKIWAPPLFTCIKCSLEQNKRKFIWWNTNNFFFFLIFRETFFWALIRFECYHFQSGCNSEKEMKQIRDISGNYLSDATVCHQFTTCTPLIACKSIIQSFINVSYTSNLTVHWMSSFL